MQHDRTAQSISAYIDDDMHIFVFPSEVAGEYRLKQSLFLSERRAVRSDRFISWDRLKEREFSPHRERIPSNILYRTVFSAALLEEHSRSGPLLRVLAGSPVMSDGGAGSAAEHDPGMMNEPGTVHGSSFDPAVFQNQLAGMLPQLKKAVNICGKEGDPLPAGLPAALAEDFRFLYRRYLEFLDTSGLFEPAYLSAQDCSPVHVYHIFFPELIDDFEEYRPFIEGNQAFRLHNAAEAAAGEETGPEGTAAEGSAGEETAAEEEKTQGRAGGAKTAEEWADENWPVMRRFPDARRECAWVVSGIHRLLMNGSHPGDIAVTLSDYEGWQPVLEEEAAVRDIPLDFRSGKMLTEYAAGRLFQRLADLSRGGMHLETLKLLCLEPAYPWNQRSGLRELVRFGIDHFYLSNWTEGNKARDELARKLKQNSEEALLKLYRNLKNQIGGLVRAPSAAELHARVHTFLHSFFATDQWDPQEERVLQYCLHVLRELEDAEKTLHPLVIPSPYALWTSLMSRRVYVSPGQRKAVPVYRYRVSAGICPRHHFMPGSGQSETRVRREEFSFLRDDYRSMLVSRAASGVSAPDVSEDFLRVYAGSGGRMYVSCSDLGFSGPQLPPSEFLAAGRVVKIDKTGGETISGDRLIGSGPAGEPSGGASAAGAGPEAGGSGIDGSVPGGASAGDPYEGEELFWGREKSMPEQLFSLQKRGFEAMRAAGFARKGTDYTRDTIAEPDLAVHMLQTARRRNSEEDGRIWLTPSSFDVYAMCPFAYLLQRGLNLTDEEYSSLVIEHRRMGTILHRILADLYGEVCKTDGRWKADRTGNYLQLADEACEREFSRRERRGEDFAPPAWYWFRHTVREQVRTFVAEESRQFDGFELEGTELELAEVCPDGGTGMWGRIDRLTRKDDAAVLVDYKKGKAPSTAEVYQEEALPPISQLPFYAHVARHNGYRITTASYYSFRDGRYTHLFTDPSGPAGAAGGSKPRLEPEQFFGQADRIAAAAEQIARRMRTGDFTIREDCPSCDFRTICRARYTLRLPEEHHGS